VSAIGDACIRLLGDRGLAARMGAAGAEWVHRDYTWEAIAARLTELIRSATAGINVPA
jgi:phosphatidylinositol alpha-1,6-mannosyltransferase